MPRLYLPVGKRRAVIERAQGCCEYCMSRADYATETFAVEHIIPVSLGGTDELDNLALSCSGCNSHKHDKIEATDPVDGALVPLFHPRRQQWYDHFAWSDDYRSIVGLTATGRATIYCTTNEPPAFDEYACSSLSSPKASAEGRCVDLH